jgi:hypothetical protein
MSFSKMFTGSKAVVLAALAEFPAEQKAIDEGYNAKLGVIEGHAKQIELCSNAVKAAAAGVDEEWPLDVNLWGHANDDGAGSWGFRVIAGGNTDAIASG